MPYVVLALTLSLTIIGTSYVVRTNDARDTLRFQAAADETQRSALPQAQHGPVLDGVRVLVVDDDADTRDLLATALSASGASVLPAGSAEEALELLRQRGADVLVSDIAMPDVDGYALMRRVRALPEPAGGLPAIALTALARPHDREDAIHAGFQAHVSKPVQIEELQEVLVSLTRRG